MALRMESNALSKKKKLIQKMIRSIQWKQFSTDDELATYIETTCPFLIEQQYGLEPSRKLSKLVSHIIQSCPPNIQKSFIMIFYGYGILTHFQTETLFFRFNLGEA